MALRSTGGVARWDRLRGFGVPERNIQRAVRLGSVRRVGRGGYALPEADPALVAAVAVNGVISHLSAARLHGLDLRREPRIIDVTVARGSSPRWPGTRMHRATLAPEDVHDRMPVTGLMRTLSDCARSLILVEAVVILDSALRQGLATMADLRLMAKTATGPGAAKLRQAVAHVDELSGSALESGLRPLLDILGVEYRSQVWIEDVGRVDFLVEGWLIIEPDGFQFHSDRRSYRDDRRRGNAAVAQGLTQLRYSWEDVSFGRVGMLRQIAAVVALGPSRGKPDRDW